MTVSSFKPLALVTAYLLLSPPIAADTGVFTSTGPMTVPRARATATLLLNGKVLIAGGTAVGYAAHASAEIYDVANGSFTPTGRMAQARSGHTATLLTNGKVLIVGGSTGDPSYAVGEPLSSAELFDPATGVFSPAASLNVARSIHSASLLPDGRVLIAGGAGFCCRLASAELYDPTANTFTLAANMNVARYGHRTTTLTNGAVLLSGGNSDQTSIVELYEPSTGMFIVVGEMSAARGNHTSTLLPSGHVLLAGGSTSVALDTADVYDPATSNFSVVGPLMSPRIGHGAALLPSGVVLLAGGLASNYLASAETFDPTSNTFGPAAAMAEARHSGATILLPQGHVLVAGGFTSGEIPTAVAEVYSEVRPPLTISVDVKPGEDPNPVNPKSKGALPVAILSAPDFNAYEVEEESIRIADPTLSGSSGSSKTRVADVNADGLPDLLVFFDVPQLFSTGAVDLTTSTVVVTGTTPQRTIQGTGTVKVVP